MQTIRKRLADIRARIAEADHRLAELGNRAQDPRHVHDAHR
jgi:hypothetical protein